MEEREWRGVVNGVLYVTQFEPTLDERVVASRAEEMVARPLFGMPVEQVVAALRAAVASGGTLGNGIPQPHDEASVQTYLTRLADRLESIGPR